MPRLLRVLWCMILTAHAGAAAGWMWLMPGGFPVGHARWWANRALPLVVIVVAAVGLIAAWRRRMGPLRYTALGVPVAWLAAALAGRLIFPLSGRLACVPAAGVAVVLGFLVAVLCGAGGLRLSPAAVVMVLAALVGAALPLTQRADDPSTRPLDASLPEGAGGQPVEDTGRPVALGERVTVRPREGRVKTVCGGLSVAVRPLLTFRSCSPDRCWTLLAPRRTRRDSPWLRAGLHHKDNVLRLDYQGGASGLLTAHADGGAVEIEAFRALERPVYSHLNTFCLITVRAHQRLFLGFSPCPDARIEVLPFDYPAGRPARLAYLGADGVFRVVEARSAEKGPFRELAAGPLARSAPLAITLYDAERAACRITLDDWAAQASTALSPTAGWGLPQNAVEFRLEDDGPRSLATLFFTLAGTSVGRGWDSVGHAAGVYRNRLRVCAAASRPAE